MRLLAATDGEEAGERRDHARAGCLSGELRLEDVGDVPAVVPNRLRVLLVPLLGLLRRRRERERFGARRDLPEALRAKEVLGVLRELVVVILAGKDGPEGFLGDGVFRHGEEVRGCVRWDEESVAFAVRGAFARGVREGCESKVVSSSRSFRCCGCWNR